MSLNSVMTVCAAASIPLPTLFGAEILSVQAILTTKQPLYIPSGAYPNRGALNFTHPFTFCNISITYTHPGQNDLINVQILLPTLPSTWNERIQGIGGSRYQAGLSPSQDLAMTASVGQGYSTIGTDAGLALIPPKEWALLSPGNVNLYYLQNLASVSLNDAAILGKTITQSFYGKQAKYAYFSGCSQGGRQGLMLAQRYPDAYDGIAVAAPAISWGELLVALFWPSFVRAVVGVVPPKCELDAVTMAAVEACDGLDGVVDGIVEAPEMCDFDARSVVGRTFRCGESGLNRTISVAAATIMNEAWAGPRNPDNTSIWFGSPKDEIITGSNPANPALLQSACTARGTCVESGGLEMAEDWISRFMLKDAKADLSKMTLQDYARIAHLSVQEYDSIIGTRDPDLSRFRARGGKIVMHHGMADSLIPYQGSTAYYKSVEKRDPKIRDFFRLFLAPGLTHCFGGPGPYPDTAFDSLRDWVENGMAPDVLNATSVDSTPVINRNLCPYPKVRTSKPVEDLQSGDGLGCQ